MVAKPSSNATPLGLSRWLLLGYYFLAISLSGYAASAIEPMKILMRFADVLPDLSVEEREAALVTVTTYGFSASLLSSLVMGVATDFLGPKITSVLGQLLFILGYCFLLVWPQPPLLVMYIGAASLGMSFMAIFTPTLSLATLFPGSTTTVLAVLGAAPDISLFVPTALKSLGNVFGCRRAILAYVCSLCVLVILNLFLFPNRAFDPLSSIEDLEVSRSTSVQVKKKESNTKQTGYATLSLGRQLLTVHFWLIGSALVLNQFRKLHYNQAVKAIIEEGGKAVKAPTAEIARMVEIFSYSLPFAVFPALCMGVFTNRFGIVAGMCLQNLWGVLLYACCIIPTLAIQFGGIVFYNLMSSYTTGICFASLATFYGFQTLGTLQGIHYLFAVLAIGLYGVWDVRVVRGYSLWISNVILFILSVAAFIVPLYTFLKPPGSDISLIGDEEQKTLCGDAAVATCDARLERCSIAGPAAIVLCAEGKKKGSSQFKYI